VSQAANDPATSNGASVEPKTSGSSSPIPFEDLEIPLPANAAPPAAARWLSFGSILLGGLLSGLIGYGTIDVMFDSPVGAAVGGLVGALIGAVGVGVVASLTLRAMNEWTLTNHPEAKSG